MAISLKHQFESAKADGLDSTQVQPSNWNDEHVLTSGTGIVLGRMTAGAGAVEELPIIVDPTGQSVRLPEGTTAQRPAGTNGMIRFNTTTGQLEAYQNGAWGNFADIALTPMAQATVKGRATGAGTGAPTDLTRAQIQRLVYNVGTLYPTFNTTADDGFLFPFGQNISRTTYSELFAKYSTTFGAGDGVNTFAMPDCRGRVLAGKDNMGGVSADRLIAGFLGSVDGDILGNAGGAEGHVLTIAQMPAHDHSMSRLIFAGAGSLGGDLNLGVSNSSPTGSTGGGAGHNNVQPTIICNFQIYTGVHA